MNNENFRQRPQVEFLGRPLMFLARRAVPVREEYNYNKIRSHQQKYKYYQASSAPKRSTDVKTSRHSLS